MSNECAGRIDDIGALPAWAAVADVRADDRLRAAIHDFFLPEESRLDDRTRVSTMTVLGELVGTVETALRDHAAALLGAGDATVLAAAMAAERPCAVDRLAGAGLLRDAELMRELFGRVRQDLLAEALHSVPADDPDRPTLLPRLAGAADPVVAACALAVLAAESRRRLPASLGQFRSTDLPAELHHRLVWWVAAALRDQFTDRAGAALPTLDRALVDAASRNIALHDEGERLEAAALRLACALDPRGHELSTLLADSLADRRVSLFIALLGRALALDYADARDLVLDSGGERLWLALRALGVERSVIARIGLALSEADPARDIEHFADSLDAIAETTPVAARQALAPLLLHRDYRAALIALRRGRRA